MSANWCVITGMQECQARKHFAGDLFLFEDTFEDNEATNGAAVYAEQGCGEVHTFLSESHGKTPLLLSSSCFFMLPAACSSPAHL